jgi:hypothetical protein
MFYVYQHLIPNTKQVFYVGKGSGKRAFFSKGRNLYWQRKANKFGFEVDFVCKNVDEEFAYFVEQELVDVYKKRNIKLTNLTAGGDGGGSCIPTEETKRKLHLALVGRKKPNGFGEKISKAHLGKKVSEETRLKLSQSHIGLNAGKKHPMFGKKHTKETREKISKVQIGRKRSKETNEKIIAYATGSFWITNGKTSKRIKGHFVLPFGWRFGKLSSKGKKR